MNQNISFACMGPGIFVKMVGVAVSAISVALEVCMGFHVSYKNIVIKHDFLRIKSVAP